MGSKGQTAGAVRWLRLNAGLTQDELARKAHISRSTLRNLEQGGRSRMLDHEAERRVAHALGVPWRAITFGTVDDYPDGTVDLVAERKARKLTPSEVADAADVPLKTVLKAEAGAAIHPRNARKLADFYGIRVTDFYPREPEAEAA
jgi:transcriptional regulator with XRE-family HTH domain